MDLVKGNGDCDDDSDDIGDIGFDDATIDDGDRVIPASKMD